MSSPSQLITSSTLALGRLRTGQAVVNTSIMDKLAPAIGETCDYEVQLNNCVINDFDGSVTQFAKPVKFVDCHFKNCAFVFAYFLQGLLIENCVFDHYLDFQAGGHNDIGYPILIKNNHFSGFVNFFDCWYKGEVFIYDNLFAKGTNINSRNQLITCEVVPIISGNQGPLNIEAEFETN
jgi:hypothetical protein